MKDDSSTDIADNVGGRRRKQKEIKNLAINLEAAENSRISRIIHAFKNGEIDQSTAFAEIRTEVSDEVYNDVGIQIRIGNRHRMIEWNDFGNSLGSYDITERISSRENRTRDTIEVLTGIADEYYFSNVFKQKTGVSPSKYRKMS